jgi:ribosomal protein S18 acetylase RimI-like enzyme
MLLPRLFASLLSLRKTVKRRKFKSSIEYVRPKPKPKDNNPMKHKIYNDRLKALLPTSTRPLADPPTSSVRCALYPSRDVHSSEIQACFDIVKSTSAADYKSSTLKWRPSEKLKEMQDENMWYILLRDPDPANASPTRDLTSFSPVIGFLSFMFTHDDPPHEDRTVLYIYEVHLIDSYRGQGHGTHLMETVENIASHVRLNKIMLTVFTSNRRGRQLYERLGFVKDECCPPDRQVRGRIIEPDYLIMSKELAV